LGQAALTAGAIAAGLSLLLAIGLAYTLMRPVREMTRAAHRLGEGDLSQRVQATGDDELAVLGQTFNRMADSLQKSEQSRRALTADIAHELRTPLAVQRAHLEALQDGIYPLTAENLTPILDQNLLLTRLVDDLRTLAMADAGQLKLERMPTDLAGLTERLADRFRPQADARGISISVQENSEMQALILDVDSMRIEQVVGNLLSNALRHTPDQGRIEISLERLIDRVCLKVRDSGPGIPPEALEHIFDRFYRADRSRNRNDGGAGLGLAIARQLAEAHGGTLEAANTSQGGAEFSLSLPG
jgi:two-component system, OmpR family, sensor histidine kinase BaeS